MQQLVEHLGYKPRTCVWEITRACNLSCAHCGSDAGRVRAGELGTDECLDVVQQLAALGTKLISLGREGFACSLASPWASRRTERI